MAALLESFFLQYGYAAVFAVLIACGFGVPIPEDITLVTGGIISGLGYTDVHIMVVVGMLGVLAGDGLVFAAGRIWGDNILKFRPIARVMTPKRFRASVGLFGRLRRVQPRMADEDRASAPARIVRPDRHRCGDIGLVLVAQTHAQPLFPPKNCRSPQQAAQGKVNTHKTLYKKQPECSVFGLLFMIL